MESLLRMFNLKEVDMPLIMTDMEREVYDRIRESLKTAEGRLKYDNNKQYRKSVTESWWKSERHLPGTVWN
jgi:hypothetical protein